MSRYAGLAAIALILIGLAVYVFASIVIGGA